MLSNFQIPSHDPYEGVEVRSNGVEVNIPLGHVSPGPHLGTGHVSQNVFDLKHSIYDTPYRQSSAESPVYRDQFLFWRTHLNLKSDT